MTPYREVWPASGGVAKLRSALTSHGIAWYHFPQACEMTPNPRLLARKLFGPSTVGRVDTATVAPVEGRTEVVRSNGFAALHTDELLLLPAHAQVMICHEQAKAGGESIYLDTWALLENIEIDDPGLFKMLFTVPDPLQPIFSWRSGSLVCGLDAGRRGGGGLQARFTKFVDQATPVVIRAEPGDVLVIDNHRVLHGRLAFSGNRKFTRLLCWLNRPFAIPHRLAALALAASGRAAASASDEGAPSWTRPAVSPASDSDAAYRLAAVIACLAGEPETRVAEELGVERGDVRWWTERVMGAGLEALSGEVGQDDSLAELSRVALGRRLRASL